MEVCQNWFYLCLAILGLFGLLFIMHLGYSLTLGNRTGKLEKKNGKELEKMEKIEKRLDQIEKGGSHD